MRFQKLSSAYLLTLGTLISTVFSVSASAQTYRYSQDVPMRSENRAVVERAQQDYLRGTISRPEHRRRKASLFGGSNHRSSSGFDDTVAGKTLQFGPGGAVFTY